MKGSNGHFFSFFPKSLFFSDLSNHCAVRFVYESDFGDETVFDRLPGVLVPPATASCTVPNHCCLFLSPLRLDVFSLNVSLSLM